MKKETGFITWINTGTIGEVPICLTVNLNYEQILKHLKGDWKDGVEYQGTVKACMENGSRMADMYRKEHLEFRNELFTLEYKDMFEEMEKLLGI